MKVFISSLIGSMSEYREAVVGAVEALGHQPIIAEDFAASSASPKVACLSGVREAGLVVLLMGESYGAVQQSGLSATHEEYREARGTKPVLVFVQEGVQHDPKQAAFVAEVEGWEGGHFRGAFSTPSELARKVTRAIYEWHLSMAVAPVDTGEMLTRATSLIELEGRGGFVSTSGPLLQLAVAGGPAQQVLRPAEIEAPHLGRTILQEAMFGPFTIFSTAGADIAFANERLTIVQQDGTGVSLDEAGSMLVKLALPRAEAAWGSVIEEDVQQKLHTAIGFASWLLNEIDPTEKLSRVVPVAHLIREGYLPWRTRAEQAASPDSFTLTNMHAEGERTPVTLQPVDRARQALAHDASTITEDLFTRLRRQRRS